MRKKSEPRILVVDDDEYDLFILREMLSGKYDVFLASDSASALSAACEFQPDLIIQDIMLPDSDGFDLCRRLKDMCNQRLVKIILISARSDISDRLKGYEAGADDYMIKPFEQEEVLAKVRVFVRLKHVEEVERLKEDVISLFAHEVRTPLSSILGFAELLEAAAALDKKQLELVSHIILNSRELLSLAEKSIFLNSIGDKLPKMKKKLVSARALLEDVAVSRESTISRKELRILRDSVDDFSIECDRNLVFDAVAALLDNAIKFSTPGSLILISSSQESGTALFTVRDSGGGFPTNFDKMSLAKNNSHDINYHGRGFGIGLTFVKCVAELHRGTLTLLETGEKGSTLELRIPGRV